MATPKDKHYWTQLRTVLTSGQWAAPFPGRTPNGATLSWSELLRKFNKHCKGFEDIAEIASQTQALELLIGSKYADEDQNDPGKTSEFALSVGEDCLLLVERIEEATAGYEALTGLKTSNYDALNCALAYYAYALGNPAECLAHLNKIADLANIQTHIPAPPSRPSTLALQVPDTGTDSISLRAGSFASISSGSIAEIKDGRAWATTEALRSICLQGMAHERLYPTDYRRALKSYAAALPLLTITESEVASSAPTPLTSAAGKLNFSTFLSFRELWRWAERLIWRAVTLSARTSNVHLDDDANPLWSWLKHYTSCSAYWPANFRPQHRSTISVLHLRALVIRAHSTAVPPTPSIRESPKPPPWLHSARTVVQEYRAILSASTSFPRAGEHNTKVEDFVDLCVSVWEASGAIGDYAGWVVDVLWWATRLTFNSFRILRHMTRLLYASGDAELAKRTLRLYVQVVGKAFQASESGASADSDLDRHWVQTLVQGSRMLCKLASAAPGLDGIEDVKEAGVLLEKAKTRLNKNDRELVASVELAEGICSSVLAIKAQDPLKRPERLAHAHKLLKQSVDTLPTPSGRFHLALSFARPGPSQNMLHAIENAGLAVESDPTEIRYWHLLGLLLAAEEKWPDAVKILDTGAAIGAEEETDSPEYSTPPDGVHSAEGIPTQPSVYAKDFGASTVNGASANESPPQHKPLFAVGNDAERIPPSSSLILPVRDHPPPSRQEMYEYSLQLRMTQAAVSEYVEGAEGAESTWVEVFAWIGEQRAPEPARSFVEGAGRASTDTKPLSDLALSLHNGHNGGPTSQYSGALLQPQSIAPATTTPIPITVSPASPDTQSLNHTRDTIIGENNELVDEGEKKRSSSFDRDTSKSKKVQQMLKNRVHKGQARISTISKKIGNGVVRNGSVRRSTSNPEFLSALHHTHYQASSIHSRRRLSSLIRSEASSRDESPPPPPVINLPNPQKSNGRISKENRLLSDLWLMSAATFRRLDKIEQAKAAIQEAEVRDEDNPAVWVQLGLYYAALGRTSQAIRAYEKALFIYPDDVAAAIHLGATYITPPHQQSHTVPQADDIDPNNVDLAAGILRRTTRGVGWDVPEAWYFLAKAYGLQGRRDEERECLKYALDLSEHRGIRDVRAAVGWCL